MIVLAPTLRPAVAGDAAALPLTVHATGAVPVLVQETDAEVAVVFELFAGAVIVTTGATPRVTETVFVSAPNAFVQATLITFAPTFSAAVAGDVAAAPLTVQSTGAVPVLVHVTDALVAVVLALSAGAVIVTTGATPLLTVTDLVSLPDAFVQTTVSALAPTLRLAVNGEVAALPLAVQVGVGVPVTVHASEVVVAVVFRLFAGAVIVTAGAPPGT